MEEREKAKKKQMKWLFHPFSPPSHSSSPSLPPSSPSSFPSVLDSLFQNITKFGGEREEGEGFVELARCECKRMIHLALEVCFVLLCLFVLFCFFVVKILKKKNKKKTGH